MSVIIPAHNAASTLLRAVSSVLAQTEPVSEIIIVDDASTDGTSEEVQRLRDTVAGPRLLTIRLPENVGAADARNAGWDLATQDYVAFLDADDAWHPQKVAIQYGWMCRHPEVALSGHRCELAADDQKTFEPGPIMPIKYFDLTSFLVSNRLSTPAAMVKRDLGVRFAGGKRYAEDYLLWMSIVSAHGPAAYIDLPLAFLFKAKYGASGLSSHAWRSHVGVLDTMARLNKDRVISTPTWVVVTLWSWVKFVKRGVMLAFSRR